MTAPPPVATEVEADELQAHTFDFELPEQWTAVDLTDASWPQELRRVLAGLTSDPALLAHRSAIAENAFVRSELMVAAGALCLLLATYPDPATTIIGAVFVQALPGPGLAGVLGEFATMGWREQRADPEVGGPLRSQVARETTVPGLPGITLAERISLHLIGDSLLSIAFTTALIDGGGERDGTQQVGELGGGSGPPTGMKAMDGAITALLRGVSVRNPPVPHHAPTVAESRVLGGDLDDAGDTRTRHGRE